MESGSAQGDDANTGIACRITDIFGHAAFAGAIGRATCGFAVCFAFLAIQMVIGSAIGDDADAVVAFGFANRCDDAIDDIRTRVLTAGLRGIGFAGLEVLGDVIIAIARSDNALPIFCTVYGIGVLRYCIHAVDDGIVGFIVQGGAGHSAVGFAAVDLGAAVLGMLIGFAAAVNACTVYA